MTTTITSHACMLRVNKEQKLACLSFVWFLELACKHWNNYVGTVDPQKAILASYNQGFQF